VPLVYQLEASYVQEGQRQEPKAVQSETGYSRGGMVPKPMFERANDPYPMLRYPWRDARAALVEMAAGQPGLEAVQIEYVNPETGASAQNILGFYALMLRPGQRLRLPARSPASVYHVIEGAVSVRVGDDQSFELAEADTCCAPGYTPVTLANGSASEPGFVFISDEAPLHRKLGVYENWG